MTEYIYAVRSNVPLTATNGIGNTPIITPDARGQGLIVRDVRRIAISNGAATADGHRIELELVERIETPS